MNIKLFKIIEFFDNFWNIIGTKGVCNKKCDGRSNTKFSVDIGPTETYYIPNQWKLIKVFDELCRFKITALIEWDN